MVLIQKASTLIQAGKWRLDGKFVDEVLKVEFRWGALSAHPLVQI